jgi:hypothetical protein
MIADAVEWPHDRPVRPDGFNYVCDISLFWAKMENYKMLTEMVLGSPILRITPRHTRAPAAPHLHYANTTERYLIHAFYEGLHARSERILAGKNILQDLIAQ